MVFATYNVANFPMLISYTSSHCRRDAKRLRDADEFVTSFPFHGTGVIFNFLLNALVNRVSVRMFIHTVQPSANHVLVHFGTDALWRAVRRKPDRNRANGLY